MRPLKPSVVLREAARSIEWDCWHPVSQLAGCDAIYTTITRLRPRVDLQDCLDTFREAVRFYKQVGPRHGNIGQYWFGLSYNVENQNRRIVALCLAAAIAESEGQ